MTTMATNATLPTPTPTASSKGTSIGVVTISGIQNVSAFLPLLGTEQCEEHVSSALERGFFYAAGTPMSIFGSLGIVKAGFTSLWVSVDKSPFHGPRQLRNAGFFPKGVMGKLAYALDTDDSIYVAEENIRSILRRYSAIGVELNLGCWPWIRWNLLMSLFTITFGSIGLMPFIYIIKFDLGRRPFSQSWLYPVLRVYGCVLVTIMIQLVIQLRVLVVVHNRLRFHAVNSWFQNNGKVPPVSWNTESRAEESLAKLANDISSHLKPAPNSDDCKDVNGKDRNSEYFHGLEKTVAATRSFSSFGVDLTADDNRGIVSILIDKLTAICLPTFLLAICRVLLLGGIAAAVIGYIGCFGLIQASNSNNAIGPGTWLAVEVTLCIIRLIIWASNPSFDDPPPPIAIHKGVGTGTVTYDIGWMLDDVVVDDLHAVVIGINKTTTTDKLWIPELRYAVSDAQSVVKYLEDSLAVPKHQIRFLKDADSGQIKQALENLATDKTIRPGAPIIIYFAGHAIGVMDEPAPTTDSSPAKQARYALGFVTSEYNSEQPETGLLYTTLLRLIEEISDNKGNNITVILDTCHAGSFGWNAKHDGKSSVPTEEESEESTARKRGTTRPEEVSEVTREESTAREESSVGNSNSSIIRRKAADVSEDLREATLQYLIGYSSHVLLAACSDSGSAMEGPNVNEGKPGGLFTQGLLHRLRATDRDAAKKLTYRGLIDNLRRDLKKYHQTPLVSGNFQNRLLFNGLFASKQLGSGSPMETSVISISTSEVGNWNSPGKEQLPV